MNKIWIYVWQRPMVYMGLFLVLAACQESSSESQESPAQKVIYHPDWSAYFEKAQVEGCFMLYQESKDTWHVYDSARVERPYLPASTFKIINAAVILETGTLPDTQTVVPWDSVDRGYARWNKSQNLRHGFRYSSVWLFQEMARRIGEETMRSWVDSARYGNQDISGGIDMFWLDGGLRISAHQQIDLMRNLVHDRLPFRPETQHLVRGLMVLEKTEDYILRGKTGWANAPDPDLGWFVGYVEKAGERWYFALNCDMDQEGEYRMREQVSREILGSLGIL